MAGLQKVFTTAQATQRNGWKINTIRLSTVGWSRNSLPNPRRAIPEWFEVAAIETLSFQPVRRFASTVHRGPVGTMWDFVVPVMENSWFIFDAPAGQP